MSIRTQSSYSRQSVTIEWVGCPGKVLTASRPSIKTSPPVLMSRENCSAKMMASGKNPATVYMTATQSVSTTWKYPERGPVKVGLPTEVRVTLPFGYTRAKTPTPTPSARQHIQGKSLVPPNQEFSFCVGMILRCWREMRRRNHQAMGNTSSPSPKIKPKSH